MSRQKRHFLQSVMLRQLTHSSHLRLFLEGFLESGMAITCPLFSSVLSCSLFRITSPRDGERGGEGGRGD
uniref:Uncharacterized protein n=1 Tax=Amphimedon queenslandica TaxID=400682 RepID=A0A1X7ULN8_AMPQE